MNRQLRLQFGNPPTRRDQLHLVGRGDTRQLAGVDQILTTPVVDRLITDLKVAGQVGHRPASLQ